MNMIWDIFKDGVKESFHDIKKHKISYKNISLLSSAVTAIFFFFILPVIGYNFSGKEIVANNAINVAQIRQNFAYIKSNMDGTFYEMKNTAKTPYP